MNLNIDIGPHTYWKDLSKVKLPITRQQPFSHFEVCYCYAARTARLTIIHTDWTIFYPKGCVAIFCIRYDVNVVRNM